MFRISTDQICRALLLSCILWAPTVRAADTPPVIHAGEPSTEEIEAIQAPSIPVLESELPTISEAAPQEASAVDPNDKGSVYTDGSIGAVVGPPPALEEAKLAMGRAAVEASRLAGTLFIMPAEEGPAEEDETLETRKLEHLSTMPPAPVVADPAAGSGVETPPVQQTGPVGLTPEEIEKLGKERK